MNLTLPHSAPSVSTCLSNDRVRFARFAAALLLLAVSAVNLPSAPTSRFLFENQLLLNTVSYARFDNTFNSTGSVTDSFVPGSPGGATSVVVQVDGKVVVGGPAGAATLGLARYNADGSLDASFGTGGKVLDTFPSDPMLPQVARGWALALQPDQKIVAVGSRGLSPSSLLVARYHADGSREWVRDIQFDRPAGYPIHVNWLFHGHLNSVAIQFDGKIVAGGYVNVDYETGREDFGIIRLNPDGTPDNTFGEQGRVRVPVSPSIDRINKIGHQPDWKIVAVGMGRYAGNEQLALVRLNTNGSLDHTFDGDGVLMRGLLTLNDEGRDLEVQPDGKIVVVGGRYHIYDRCLETAVIRFNSDGSLDPSFGVDGSVSFPYYGQNSGARSVLLNDDGKILVGGFADNGNNSDFALARLNADGSLDRTFDKDGRAVFDLGGSVDSLHDMAFYDDTRLIIVGIRGSSIGVARISTDVSVPPTPFDFDADGRADLSVFRPSNSTWYTQTSEGFSARVWGQAGDEIAPADYDGDGRTDFAVFRPSNGTWYVINSDTQTFQIIPWGEDGDMPIASDANADGRADLVLYRSSNSTWYTRFAGSGGYYPNQYGQTGDKPVKGDFDGDGVPDLATYRPSDNTWRISKSSGGTIEEPWGQGNDILVPADYDGDDATDIAIWRPSTGQWYIIGSSAGWMIRAWGEPGDIPAPADYDADGRADLAIFRPANGTWYVVMSASGHFFVRQFGQAGDVPLASAFVN